MEDSPAVQDFSYVFYIVKSEDDVVILDEENCPADFNLDGSVDGQDVEAFFLAWESGDPDADVNADGGVDGMDVETFFVAWEAGGC